MELALILLKTQQVEFHNCTQILNRIPLQQMVPLL